MIDSIRKSLRMLPPGARRRWLGVVPLTLLTSAMEAATAAAIFALFQMLSDPAAITSIPWVTRIVKWLPARDQQSVLLQLIALVALYYLARTGVAIWSNYARHRILHDASAALSSAMLQRYLAAPYPFHFRRNSAELIRNCTTAVGQVMGVVLGTLASAASELVVTAGLCVVLLSAAPLFSIIAASVVFLVLALLLRLTRQAASRFGSRTHQLSSRSLQTLQQAFGGIKEVKVLGRERFFFDEFDERQRELLVLGYQGITLHYLPLIAVQAVMVLGGLSLVALLVVVGDGTGRETLPLVGLFGYAAMRLIPSANWLLHAINDLRASAQTVDELYEDFVALSEPLEERLAADTDGLRFREAIALEHVSYRYPTGDRDVLHDVSLTVHQGESIGIVGATGAGKSTLVDIILGLLPPMIGRVTVDGVDLARAAAPWRRRVGYVPQSIYLTDDTLRRNIALGIPDARIDEAAVRSAVRMAQLEELTRRLPNGLDTRLGERGIRFSGGERQRVGIARALYHDPDLLVFDEATSSLDVATEADISRTIQRLRGRKTMLVVAHRLSTVRACDRLVYLRDGRVAGIGSFDDLKRQNEDFRALAALAAV